MTELRMRKLAIWTVVASVPALAVSAISMAQAPAPAAPNPLPVLAPSLPPSKVVDLASAEGMSAFGGQWKNMDVKIVEVPAMPNAGPAWKMAYDIQPKA